MAVTIERITKVVIRGEWYSVEQGSFRVEELAFTDREGRTAHEPTGLLAYRFHTPNRDEYYGPLSSVDLFKLADT